MMRILTVSALLGIAACSHGDLGSAKVVAGASDASVTVIVVARGNEPGWRVTIGAKETEFLLDYGERRFTAPTPRAEMTDAGAVYRYAGATLTISDAICADDATGMPYPKVAVLEEGGLKMSGCAGEPASLLTGDEWVVEDIGGGGVIDFARTSMMFTEDGKVSGSGACNRYGGTYALNGEGLSFGPIAATKKGCPPAVMDQENRFFAALESVDRFEIDETGALVLYGADAPLLLARR